MGPLLAAIGVALGEALGRRVRPQVAGEVGGGCINQAFRVTDGKQNWFVKINRANCADMFAAESDGLGALAKGPLRAPQASAKVRRPCTIAPTWWTSSGAAGWSRRLGRARSAAS